MSTRGARRRQTSARASQGLKQLPWKQPQNPYPVLNVISEDQVEQIHHTSLRVIAELGIKFMDSEALSILREKGAEVDESTQMVRMAPELVMAWMGKVPERFTMHSRNREHSLEIGENNICFAMVASAPNASDTDNGRRPGNFEDFSNLVRLAQSFNVIHCIGGYPVEPVDLPPDTRHLDCGLAFHTLTDKVLHAYSLGKQRITDSIEMLRIARGVSMEQLKREPGLFSIINTSSPLRVDGVMLQGMMEMVRHGQCVCVTPFTLAGAMAPVSLAGALVQQNAEALATIAFAQMVAPGAPMIYGSFSSNVDMRTGSPAFGTPELAQTTLAGAQLARRYKIPYRASGVSTSNTVDAQASYETMMALWPCVQGHTNLIKHAAGWMEGGLCASFEKVVLDVENLQMLSQFLIPMKVDESELGFDAIKDVGPGGHFFGTAHTLERYETAFYSPIVSDWNNFENWQDSGSLNATERANKLWKQVLQEFSPPPLDAAKTEELEAFVAKRKENPGIN